MGTEFSTQEQLMAYAIGMEVLKYLRTDEMMRQMLLDMESKAIQVLREIRDVLNNDALDDPECFQRIDAIIDIYAKNFMGTQRHDW